MRKLFTPFLCMEEFWFWYRKNDFRIYTNLHQISAHKRLLFFLIADNEIEPDKRGDKLLPVAFQCSRPTAVCRNHGRGPKVTMSRKRRGAAMCVCLCPPGYTRPQCARKNKPVRWLSGRGGWLPMRRRKFYFRG